MVDSIERSKGLGPAPRADRPGDPDGLRRHGQAPVPGRLRAHRGRRRRDASRSSWRSATSARRSPSRSSRSSPAPRSREEIAALRAHGVDLDVHDEDRPVDVAAAGDSPLKGKTVGHHRRVHRPALRREGQPPRRHAPGRAGRARPRPPRSRRAPTTCWPAPTSARRRPTKADEARRHGRRPGRAVGLAGRGRRGVALLQDGERVAGRVLEPGDQRAALAHDPALCPGRIPS